MSHRDVRLTRDGKVVDYRPEQEARARDLPPRACAAELADRRVDLVRLEEVRPPLREVLDREGEVIFDERSTAGTGVPGAR